MEFGKYRVALWRDDGFLCREILWASDEMQAIRFAKLRRPGYSAGSVEKVTYAYLRGWRSRRLTGPRFVTVWRAY